MPPRMKAVPAIAHLGKPHSSPEFNSLGLLCTHSSLIVISKSMDFLFYHLTDIFSLYSE